MIQPTIQILLQKPPRPCRCKSSILLASLIWLGGASQQQVVAATQQPNKNSMITFHNMPGDVEVECNGKNFDPDATGGMPTATDSSSGIHMSVTYIDTLRKTDCPYPYTIERKWIATDESGDNRSEQIQYIKMDGREPPTTLNFPHDVFYPIGNSVDTSVTGTAVAAGSCGALTVSYSDRTREGAATDTATAVNIIRTWTVTQECGRKEYIQDQKIVLDTQKPEFLDRVGNVMLECGLSTDPSMTGEPLVSDNADYHPVSSHSDSSLRRCGQAGYVARTWTATDRAGNSESMEQLIDIDDTTVPTFLTIPADVHDIIRGHSILPKHLPGGPATATDTCSPTEVGVSYSDVDNGDFIARTWTATDPCGNQTKATQTIHFAGAPPQHHDDSSTGTKFWTFIEKKAR